MAANIIITVTGQGSGSGGESRAFPYSIIQASPPLVSLSIDNVTGVTSYLWELLNQPYDASASLSSQSSSNPNFTPTATKWGSYLIRCTILRNGVQEIGTVVLSFRTPNHDLRFPAAGEKIEFHTDDGWAEAEYWFWKYVDDLSVSGSSYWKRVGTILSPLTAGDTVQIGSGSVGSPSYSYESDIDTGRRLYNTGIESFVVGGVDQLLFGNSSGPYIKAADGHQYLRVGNYKTTSGNYSEVIIEGVGHINHGGGKATLQSTAPSNKITETNVLSTSSSGQALINIIADSGVSISDTAIVTVRAQGEGPSSLLLSAATQTNAVDSIISVSSTSLLGDSYLNLEVNAPSGNSYLNLGSINTGFINFIDKYLDASSYPANYFTVSNAFVQWDNLYTRFGTKTLIEILNTLYDSGGNTVSAGIGIDVIFASGDYEVSVKDAPASEIDFNVLSGYSPTNFDLQTYFNFIQGPTKLTSAQGLVTDGGSGTANVSSFNGIVKSTSVENSSTVFVNWPSVTSLGLSDNDVNYVTANYAVTPIITASTDLSASIVRDKILLSIVKRESTSVEFTNIDAQNADLGYSLNEKIIVQSNYKPEYGTGIIIGGTGTRNLFITPGWMYWGLSKIMSSEFDSSVASTWTSFYTTDSGTTWTKVLSQTQIDNLNYNDIASGLAALPPDTFGLFWVYRNYSNTDIYVVYGTEAYGTQALAEVVPAPSLVPWQVNEFSYLIGRVIVEESTDVLDVTSVFVDDVAVGAASVHNLLSNIQGGVATERYHLTNTQHNDLTVNMPLAPISVVYTDSSNQLSTHANFKYSPGGTTGYLNFTIEGSSIAAGSIVSKSIDGNTSLGLVSTSVGTSGGNSVVSIESNGNDGNGSYGIYTSPQGEHRWRIDSKDLLYLNLVSLEHTRLTGKQKYLDIYNVHITPTTDEDSTILITNTAYNTSNITIENSSTSSSGIASISIKALVPDGDSDIDIFADSYTSVGGSSSVVVRARGNAGSAKLLIDTDNHFYIDDVEVLRISDFIDPNDETELSIPYGTGDRTLYIRNQQPNGSVYTSIINKCIATDAGSTEAGLGFICEATETGVESYIQIEAISSGSTSSIDIISQYTTVSALNNLVLETTSSGNIDINPAASSVIRFGTNYVTFPNANLATTTDWTNFYSTFGNKSVIEAMLTLSGGGGLQSLDDCYNIGETITVDTSPVTLSVPSGSNLAALSVGILNTAATSEVVTILNSSNEGNNNGILFQGNAGGGTGVNLYGHKIWSIGSITMGHSTGTGDTTRKSLVSCQYSSPLAVDSAVAMLESTAYAAESTYARIKTVAGAYGALGGTIEMESTGSLSIDSSSGSLDFGSSITITAPVTNIISPKFVVGESYTMNHGNYARGYGIYGVSLFEGASHFSNTRRSTTSGTAMGGNGLILSVETSGNETKYFRYRLTDTQTDADTPFKIPENRIVCIGGTVVSSCVGSHIDAVYVQKFYWVLWNGVYHADESDAPLTVILNRSSWTPAVSITPLATDGWFNLGIAVSGASVGDTVLHVCHITEFTVSETAYVASS